MIIRHAFRCALVNDSLIETKKLRRFDFALGVLLNYLIHGSGEGPSLGEDPLCGGKKEEDNKYDTITIH